MDVMSTRISTCCRTKHIDRGSGEVVPCVAQILKRRWDAAASITVVELVRQGGVFKVVKPFNSTRPRQQLSLAQHATQCRATKTLFTLLNQSCGGEPAAFGKMCSTPVGMVVLSFRSERKRISAKSSRIWCIPTKNLRASNRCTKTTSFQHALIMSNTMKQQCLLL